MAEETHIETAADVMATLNKHYGKVVVASGASRGKTPRIRIGVPMVDYVMGGGIPINRIIEFVGPESSGKSYMAYKSIAKVQHYDFASGTEDAFEEIRYKSVKHRGSKKDGLEDFSIMVEDKKILSAGSKLKVENTISKRAVLIDYENSYDPTWGASLGINNDGLIHIVPDSGSEAVDIIEAFTRNPEIGIIVIDSIGVISSDLETDESMEKEQMGVNARFWNKAMRKIQTAMNSNPERDLTIVAINRVYAAIGKMYGDPTEVGGGSGIKFAKAVSVKFNPLKEIKGKDSLGNEITVGRNVSINCIKNKTARPHLRGSFYMSFVDDGVVKAGETDVLSQVIDLGMICGIITRKGAYYNYKDLSILGREAFVLEIDEQKLADKITKEVFTKIYA